MNVCCTLETYEIERANNGANEEWFCFINDRFAPNINCNIFTLWKFQLIIHSNPVRTSQETH
jgi:hypothetical protein